jgi:hypothetical protein
MEVCFVITVPHAQCLSEHILRGLHYCDTVAGSAADKLYSLLLSSGAHVEPPIKGTINRSVSDLNRQESRWTEWRRGVDKVLGRLTKVYKVFLVDVHSYGESAPWASEIRPSLALLDGRSAANISGVPELLRTQLPELIVAVGGSPQNDIVYTAAGTTTWAVLVEIDETQPNDHVIMLLTRAMINLTKK